MQKKFLRILDDLQRMIYSKPIEVKFCGRKPRINEELIVIRIDNTPYKKVFYLENKNKFIEKHTLKKKDLK